MFRFPASDNHDEPKHAIVNGKPWYNSRAPYTDKSNLKPVPGITPPVPLQESTRQKIGYSNVSIGKDVESVLNQYTEEIQVLPPQDGEGKTCVICFDDLFATSSLNGVVELHLCNHIFHKSCLKAMYDSGSKNGCLQCPYCKTIHGEKWGTQPPGTMDFHILPHSLPGYSDCETIRIVYDILEGVQGPEHPNPGKRFTAAFPRHCYLPHNEDGRNVLKLLVKAWERRLIFTVGTSATTGAENTVTWTDIHHKTEFGSNTYGHGFPDPNYFENVLFALAAQGVTES